MERSPSNNRLLALLPARQRRRFLERCEPVDLVLSEILQQPGTPIRHVLFPLGSLVSQLTSVDGQVHMETGLVGDEGMLGATVALGIQRAPALSLVQGAGPALQMETRFFRQELAGGSEFRAAVQRYLYVVMCQVAQTAVCTRFHVVEERLARWLLMTSDRARSCDFHITHEFLASMLGVRRAGVTRAAGSLQALGLIQYDRGEMIIRDRAGLERAACTCYATDRAVYDQVLGRSKLNAVRRGSVRSRRERSLRGSGGGG